jgi:hypothetical protein
VNPFAPSREERAARRSAPPAPTFREAIGRFLIKARWALAVIYGLCALALYVIPWVSSDTEAFYLYIPLVLGLALQFFFCFARGDPTTLQPVTFKRSWLPLVIGGLAGAVLAAGAALAFGELFYFDKHADWAGYLWMIFFGSWLLWTLFFTFIVMNLPRLNALRRILLSLLAGTMLQLITTITAHVLVERRGGCLVGLATAMGILCGAAVLFWAFGPGIVLLFYYEARNRRGGYCPGCGYNLHGLTEKRCPECGRAFTPREGRPPV